jgi:hypothetical protein
MLWGTTSRPERASVRGIKPGTWVLNVFLARAPLASGVRWFGGSSAGPLRAAGELRKGSRPRSRRPAEEPRRHACSGSAQPASGHDDGKTDGRDRIEKPISRSGSYRSRVDCVCLAGAYRRGERHCGRRRVLSTSRCLALGLCGYALTIADNLHGHSTDAVRVVGGRMTLAGIAPDGDEPGARITSDFDHVDAAADATVLPHAPDGRCCRPRRGYRPSFGKMKLRSRMSISHATSRGGSL